MNFNLTHTRLHDNKGVVIIYRHGGWAHDFTMGGHHFFSSTQRGVIIFVSIIAQLIMRSPHCIFSSCCDPMQP